MGAHKTQLAFETDEFLRYGMSGDGSIDPAQYGVNDQHKLLLRFATFSTIEECSHRGNCRYRHEPLTSPEIAKILLGSRTGFIAKYLHHYGLPDLPYLGGIPFPERPPADDSERLRMKRANGHKNQHGGIVL
ncbi:hypothetical protein IQ07DRAFT_594560 [Pyrenochaeta sp. DS3sAY3a]|nr:hypothetical protein IQ07DRAFT_594560 [Pyrenochaeta sp. DS3sAY3a]